MKRCPRCKLEKDLEEFHRATKAPDGRQGHCKACKKELGKIYEKTRSREKKKEYARNEWQSKKNNPRYIEYRKKWLSDNREELKKKAREYREKNRVFLLHNGANSKARTRGFPGIIGKDEWLAALKISGGICLACEEIVADTIDHVLPLSKGGRNDYKNIQPLCLRCNLKKGTREIDFRPDGFIERIEEECSKSAVAG